MILFVNACVREKSRTERLADYLLEKLGEPVKEILLYKENFPVVTEEFLVKREKMAANKETEESVFSYAKDFAEADSIVIAAPFWDLSFPALLKQYLEQVNVAGITFSYSEKGIPVSHCKATKLYYVTTAGGPIFAEEFGYGYIKALANNFYGISDTVCIRAEGLDIWGADVEGIMKKAEDEIDSIVDVK